MSARLLIIGHIDDPEFQGLSSVLDLLRDESIEQIRSLGDLLRQIDSTTAAGSPDLIVVVECHPDEHSPSDVQRLIEMNPLARIVCGYGPWSESAARTRGTWPAAAWVPIAMLPERIMSELAVLRGERTPLAITADRTDAFEERYSYRSDSLVRSSCRVAIDSPDPEYRSMLEDELTLRGATTVNATEPWDVLLFDAHPEESRLRQLERLLSQQNANSGIVLILHEMPSEAARSQWADIGNRSRLVIRVVSKLTPLASLELVTKPSSAS